MSQQAMMRPRSAASLAPALFFFQADRPTQTARSTTRTAAPATPWIVPVTQDQIKGEHMTPGEAT